MRDAFTLMRDQGVMGLPVVDQNGLVVESVSVSDLKQIGFDGSLFSKLDISIKVRDSRKRMKVANPFRTYLKTIQDKDLT